MIPITSTIQGFGPFRDPTAIDWSALPSPSAILAKFGTGKTWLIEAGILFPLFGRGGWYGGSIYDALTQGGNGQAEISLTFDHGGQRYTVTRTIKDTGKTKTHRAVLTRAHADESNTGEMIGGPKSRDCDRVITAIIGGYDTAVATWLLAQNRLGDLCGQPGDPDLAARRRDVFHRLLGADVLDAHEKRIVEQARKDRTIAEELEAQLGGEGGFAEKIVEEQTELASARARLAEERLQLQKAEQDLEAARTALRDAEGGDDVLQGQIKEHARAELAVAIAETAVNDLAREIMLLDDRAAGLDQSRHDANRLEELKAEREEFNVQQSRFDERQAWERRRDELAQKVAGIKENIATIEAVPGVDDETRALAGRVDELRRQYKAAKSESVAIEERNALREIDRRSFRQNIAGEKAYVAEMTDRITKQPETPGGDACATCPLLEEYSGLPAKRDRRQVLLDRYEAALAAIPPDEELADLADLIAQGERAAAATEAVAKESVRVEILEKTLDTLTPIVHALNRHVTETPDPVENPGPGLQILQAEIDTLAGAPERVGICERARADAEVKQVALDAARDSLVQAQAETVSTREQAESARAALADREAQRRSLSVAWSKMVADVSNRRHGIEETTASIASAETRLEELERRQAEQAKKADRVRTLRDTLEGLADLRLCFGSRGVRQIFIDAAVPELEDIAADLFARATDGRQQLRIATQRATADGSTAEAFDILVRDECGERDVTRFSGGQLQLIQILFRIAVALWVGRMRGQKADCLFLDEAFDRLGAEGTEDLLRVLEYLGDSISLIVVVTHDPQIAARMRSQLRLAGTFGGVQIQAVGGV